MAEFRLETERLVIRSWRDADISAFHAICRDPLVMATLGPLMSLAETEALVGRERTFEAELGHTFWVVERREDARLIGKCGIIRGRVAPILDLPEIGWRLAADCWGQGYITEAAQACVQWFFANRDDEAIWAITSADNQRSLSVMTRLGMVHQPALDFDHPRLEPGDPLLRHVTYRLARAV